MFVGSFKLCKGRSFPGHYAVAVFIGIANTHEAISVLKVALSEVTTGGVVILSKAVDIQPGRSAQ